MVVTRHPSRSKKRPASGLIKKGCEEHDLPYVDTSEDFLGAIEVAAEYLVGDLD